MEAGEKKRINKGEKRNKGLQLNSDIFDRWLVKYKLVKYKIAPLEKKRGIYTRKYKCFQMGVT